MKEKKYRFGDLSWEIQSEVIKLYKLCNTDDLDLYIEDRVDNEFGEYVSEIIRRIKSRADYSTLNVGIEILSFSYKWDDIGAKVIIFDEDFILDFNNDDGVISMIESNLEWSASSECAMKLIYRMMESGHIEKFSLMNELLLNKKSILLKSIHIEQFKDVFLEYKCEVEDLMKVQEEIVSIIKKQINEIKEDIILELESFIDNVTRYVYSNEFLMDELNERYYFNKLGKIIEDI